MRSEPKKKDFNLLINGYVESAPKNFEDLKNSIVLLSEDLARFSTKSFCNWMGGIWHQRWNEIADDLGLPSPLKQLQYLLYLMLSTPEPDEPIELNDGQILLFIEQLNNIFGYYWRAQEPPENYKDLTEEERFRYLVAGSTTMGAFNNARHLTFPEQWYDFLSDVCLPYEDWIRSEIGFSANDAIGAAKKIEDEVQRRLEILIGVSQSLAESYREFCSLYDSHRYDELEGFIESTRSQFSHPSTDLNGLQSYHSLPKHLLDYLGADVSSSFWHRFTVKRGFFDGTLLPDAENPILQFPFVDDGSEEYRIPIANSVALAINLVVDQTLKSSPKKEGYLKRRTTAIERITGNLLSDFLGAGAKIYVGAYETADNHHERDVIILYRDCLIICECKSSDFRNPLVNLAKTYERLERDYKAKNGIQGGYDQQTGFIQRAMAKGVFELFDNQGNQLMHLPTQNVKRIFNIIVTASEWGMLGATPLLLKMSHNVPIPWVIPLFHLESFLNALSLRGFRPRTLLSFLKQREALQGIVISADESEICGAFVIKGCLDLFAPEGVVQVMPNPLWSEIFDDIWSFEQYGKPIDWNLNYENTYLMRT